MARPSIEVEFRVLTEDTSRHAHDVVSALVRHMTQIVDEHTQTHRLEFLQPPAGVHGCVSAMCWRGAVSERERRDLVRSLVTDLVTAHRDGVRFVIFHIDADVVWSQLESDGVADWSCCENYVAWYEQIRKPLLNALTSRFAGRAFEPLSAEAARRLVDDHLFVILPVYTIESWLYQHTAEAVRLCHAHHGGHCVELFESWADDRTALDEIEQPKDETVLTARYNLELATAPGFPAEDVYLAERSFHCAVERLGSSESLIAALERTWRWPVDDR